MFGIGSLGCLDGWPLEYIAPRELQLYTLLCAAFSTVKLASFVYVVLTSLRASQAIRKLINIPVFFFDDIVSKIGQVRGKCLCHVISDTLY